MKHFRVSMGLWLLLGLSACGGDSGGGDDGKAAQPVTATPAWLHVARQSSLITVSAGEPGVDMSRTWALATANSAERRPATALNAGLHRGRVKAVLGLNSRQRESGHRDATTPPEASGRGGASGVRVARRATRGRAARATSERGGARALKG